MRVRALALAGISAVLLTACGGGSSDDNAGSTSSSSSASERSASDIAAEAADALENATAVHIQGSAPSEGLDALDLRFQGGDVAGSITMGGQALQLIVAGGASYVQAPAAFWTANGVPADAVAVVDGVWVLLPAEAAAQLTPVSQSAIADEIRALADPAVDQKVSEDTLDGQPVLVLTQGDGSTLHVAAGETAYPLQVADTSGTLAMSEYDQPQAIAAPTDFIDLSQVGA